MRRMRCIESIGERAFDNCNSLTTVSFPTTLTPIGECVFFNCSSLENVDLLHTNLQELDRYAFRRCSELKSKTIPDSLQTLWSQSVFLGCSKLVPSSIDVSNEDDDTTSEFIAHLRLQQLLAGNNFLNTDDFRRLLVQFLPNDTLMTMRLASKPWSRVVDAFIDEGVRSGELMVHVPVTVIRGRVIKNNYVCCFERRWATTRWVLHLKSLASMLEGTSLEQPKKTYSPSETSESGIVIDFSS